MPVNVALCILGMGHGPSYEGIDCGKSSLLASCATHNKENSALCIPPHLFKLQGICLEIKTLTSPPQRVSFFGRHTCLNPAPRKSSLQPDTHLSFWCLTTVSPNREKENLQQRHREQYQADIYIAFH